VNKVMSEAPLEFTSYTGKEDFVGGCTKCYKPILRGDEVEDFGMLYHKACRKHKSSKKSPAKRPTMGKAGPSTKTAPTTFDEFRTLIGSALEKAGAPPDLVEEILDLDLQGGGVAQALFSTWESVEYEMSDITHDNRIPEANKPQEKWEVFTYYSHDCVINVLDAFGNAWNYGPGRGHQWHGGPLTSEEEAGIARAVEQILKA